MKENVISLRDINNMTSKNSRESKRILIEKKNMAASLKIAAHNKLKVRESDNSINDLRNKVSNQILDDKIPDDAYLSYFEGRIKALQARVDNFEAKKIKNGGVLLRGEDKALENFSIALEEIKAEKNEFLAKRREEDERVSRERAAQLLAEREQIARKKREMDLAESIVEEPEQKKETESII